MASIKISDLASVTTLTDNDVMPIVNGNDTKKVSLQQLGDKITSAVIGTKIPYYILNLTTRVSDAKVNLNATDMEALGNIFTDAYANNHKLINILLCATTNGGNEIQLLLLPSVSYANQYGQPSILSKPTSYVFEYFSNRTGYVGYPADQKQYTIIFGWMNVYAMSWSDDVCTVTGCQFNGTGNAIPTVTGVLMKTNSFSYTPTANYHPATKKYVDDKTWVGTQAEYDALTTHSDSTIYFIKEDTNASE